MMAAPAPVIRKFNPGALQSDEQVIEQFVVRHREFGILMDILRNNAGPSICQHTLIIAPRGRGKTMMLARIAAELRSKEVLRSTFLPVRFMEESYEVFDAGEFWLEALFHLSPEVAPYDAELAAELREAHAEFARRWRGRDLEEHARTLVLETAGRLGRKIVLMVENCHALFDNVDEHFGWSLRKTLQTEPNVIFLGTATTRMAALDDVQAPFYEFFRPLLLDPLPLSECKTLWEAASGESRSEREIRPLQILTGGDPRLLVIIAGFARHRSLKELLEELVSLIDDHTEYFRSHLEGLSKTERRVYLALIDLWRPSTTAEIAARSMQEIRAVSSLLGRLVKRGAVAYEGQGQKRLYSATQRLYSIYYKLRRQRDEAAVVQSLIQWMVACFTGDELRAMDETLATEAMQSASIREGFRLALRDMPAVRKTLSEVAGRIDAAEMQELITKAQRYAESDDPAAALAPCEEVLRRFSGRNEWAPLLACALIVKGNAHERIGSFDDAIAAYADVAARFGDEDAPAVRVATCMALSSKAAAEILAGRLAAALNTSSHINERYGTDDLEGVQEWAASALTYRGVAGVLAGERDLALAAWDQVVAQYGCQGPAFHDAVVFALATKANYLARFGDPTLALATCAELAERFGDSDEPDVRRAVAGAEWTRTQALLANGQRDLALKALQSAYDLLIVDEDMPALLLHHVPELIGRGLTERELLHVLTSDPQKSATMSPIIATLQGRLGEPLRVPVEVLEVAKHLAVRLDQAIERARSRQ